MQIVSRVSQALQRLLGETADESARSSGTIQRRRKFTGSTLVATLVLGCLRKPDAEPEDLARTAAELIRTNLRIDLEIGMARWIGIDAFS